MKWLSNLLNGNQEAAPSAAAAEPAPVDLSLEVLVNENIRIGVQIEELRERRRAIKVLIDQKIHEREAAAGVPQAVLKGV